MREKVIIFGKSLVVAAIPGIITFVGSSDLLDVLYKNNILGSKFDIDKTKLICQILGAVIFFVIVTYQMSVNAYKIQVSANEINGLLYQNKNIFELGIATVLGKRVGIDIRIFVPLKKRINFNKNEELYFHIKNYSGLCNVGITNNLKFKVLPDTDKEGLVGECYNTGAMIYDDNLKENNSTQYNLNYAQISKTRELKFSIVCPLYDEHNSIVAIVAYDGREEISITDNNKQEIVNAVVTFAQMLYENAPELFKPIRRII